MGRLRALMKDRGVSKPVLKNQHMREIFHFYFSIWWVALAFECAAIPLRKCRAFFLPITRVIPVNWHSCSF
ncbi:hypothetical protein Y032_0375g230 [Ancylostoma ceylanicum]|uniref:Uncharacterized protein n=1 Tax=Ancylostoma ceylanicum TaxID=53326 RepID=A0A016RUP9_9BILA|nr:hypothetical protein Y032_0375g230 [Ancylostoma ceylanicum]